MLKIRNMRLEDIPQVAELERQVFPDPWSERSITESWEQKQTLLLSAFTDEKLIGYVILYFVFEEAEIARIAVAEEYRKTGVGSRMLREMVSLCIESGISKIMLDVRESNRVAYDFYVGHGFEVDGIRKNYYTNPVENAVLMSCIIG